MKRFSSVGFALLLLIWLGTGCIVVNIERKPEPNQPAQPAKAKEVDVITEEDVAKE